jgi:peptide/nickel transport system substrate-binding protein
MSGGSVEPGPFRSEVGEDVGCADVAHPVVGVASCDSVLGVLVRPLRRLGRGLRRGGLARGGHRRHRSAAGVAALALAAGALSIPAVASPSAADSTSGSDEPVTFTVGLLNEVDSFNPFNGIEASSYEMWALTYDFLVGYSMKDMSPEPALAKSWETSEDGLTWTFHMRDDVTWSDGEPLTANDVAYTYNRVLDGGPEAATWSSYLTSVEKIEATDDYTLEMTLSKPNAVLPLLPIPIVPEHVWKDVSEDEVKSYAAEPTDGQPVVGSGPFRLVEGTAGGDTYRFEANPDYWGGAPHVDQVVYRVYKSEDPAVQALIKGEIDFVQDISALQVQSLQGQEGITAHNGDSPGFDEIAFNTGARDPKTEEPIGDGNPALEDPAFRHALGYAIDYDQIIEKAYQGAGQVGDSIIPPAYSTWRWEPSPEQAFTFDLEKAGQLLDEAGYTMGDDGKRTMPDGSPIGTLRLYARSESKTSINVLNFFQEWLDQLGIDSEVTAYESNKLTNIILDGEFDVFEWGWYVEPDPDSILSYLTCGQRGSWSDSWYCDADYDRMYEEQNSATDDAERVAIVKQMQEQLFMDSPYLVTAYSTIGEAVRTDRFACFQPQPDPGGVWIMQYGARNYTLLRPADEAGDCDGVTTAIRATGDTSSADEGIGTGVWIGIGVLAGVVIIGGLVFAMRRRSTAGERE